MKRIAITGAAAGIGLAIAERFGREGWTVVGIDRDRQAAERARFELVRAGCDVSFMVCDLTQPDGRAAVLAALAAGGALDAFVHNAGVNQVGPFDGSDLAGQRRVLETNLLAPLLLTPELLRHGRLAPRASLVFVSSLSRFVGYPGAAVYAASKDGIASYARSLRAAGSARGLHVLTVYPGPTRTEHARRHAPPPDDGVDDGVAEARRMPPEALAARVWRAVRRRRRVLVPGAANGAFAAFGHVLPRASDRVLKKVLYDRFPARRDG